MHVHVQYFGLTSRGRMSQYRLGNIQRELNKCFAAFSVPSVQPSIPVATGYALLSFPFLSCQLLFSTNTALIRRLFLVGYTHTSNWGCGAFGGYHDIKSIIQVIIIIEEQQLKAKAKAKVTFQSFILWSQLMAAAVTGRQLHYYTFGEPGLAASMNEVYAILKAKNVTVGMHNTPHSL